MVNEIKKIILIGGCQRSGTTLAGQILGAHPDALLIDETDGLYGWFHAEMARSGTILNLDAEIVARSKIKYKPGSEKLAHADSYPFKYLVLKGPNLIYYYKELSRITIPLVAIFLIRDPRSVVASMMELEHIPMVENQLALIRKSGELMQEFSDDVARLEDPGTPEIIKRALIWRIKSGMYVRFKDVGLPVYVLKYEDLVRQKGESISSLVDFTGLPANGQMASHQDVYRGFGPGLTDRTRPVDILSLDRWKERLTLEQGREILEVAGALAEQFGYKSGSEKQVSSYRFSIDDLILRSPLIFTGRGGSGTRIISELVRKAGIFLGNRFNKSGDSMEWVDLIYEISIQKLCERAESITNNVSQWEQRLLNRARAILGAGEWTESVPWGWKLPESMLIMPELFSVFPHAKLIHIVRHPVDSSLRRTHKTSRRDNPVGTAVLDAAYRAAGYDPAVIDTHDTYIHNALTWNFQVKQVIEFARGRLNPDQYLEILYEDFYSNVPVTQAKILRFIGKDSHFPPLVNFETNRIRNYSLPDTRADEIWELCGETAVKLGYEKQAPYNL